MTYNQALARLMRRLMRLEAEIESSAEGLPSGQLGWKKAEAGALRVVLGMRKGEAREAVAAALEIMTVSSITAKSVDGWCAFDGGPHQMVIVGGVSRCEKCTTCEGK